MAPFLGDRVTTGDMSSPVTSPSDAPGLGDISDNPPLGGVTCVTGQREGFSDQYAPARARVGNSAKTQSATAEPKPLPTVTLRASRLRTRLEGGRKKYRTTSLRLEEVDFQLLKAAADRWFGGNTSAFIREWGGRVAAALLVGVEDAATFPDTLQLAIDIIATEEPDAGAL